MRLTKRGFTALLTLGFSMGMISGAAGWNWYDHEEFRVVSNSCELPASERPAVCLPAK